MYEHNSQKEIYLLIGNPKAKSLLCVQNIANIPALPRFIGFETSSVTAITEKNIIPLANRIASRNIQLTVLKSRRASDRNMRDGKAKVPTNVAIPLDSVEETTFRRPATYLKII